MQCTANMAGRSLGNHCVQFGIAAPVRPTKALLLRRCTRSSLRAAVEAATPIIVVDAEDKEDPGRKLPQRLGETSDPKYNKSSRKETRQGKGMGEGDTDSTVDKPQARDRAVVRERSRVLVNGEAVGLTMDATVKGVAAGFKGLRPLGKELNSQSQTLLYFPSTRLAKSEQPPSTSKDVLNAEFEEGETKQQTQKQSEKLITPRVIDLALVAVPYFKRPEAEVTIRVGAKSNPGVIARTLTRALIRSSSVVIQAAGPAAALVALQAAAQSRRAIGAEQQLDLAFSIEFLTVPATVAKKPPTDEEVVPEAAAAAEEPASETAAAVVEEPAPETAAAVVEEPALETAAAAAAAEEPALETTAATVAMASPGAAVAAVEVANPSPEATPAKPRKTEPMASILQFSFYKRELPIPEVLVSDFASTRSGPAMSQLLVSLISERREVNVVLDSADALFTMQTLIRVVRDSWLTNKASIGIFLTSMNFETTETSFSTLYNNDESNDVRFTAQLQLRRIPGAPNLVSLAEDRKSILGTARGVVKWDSPIRALANAMNRECYSAGIFSLWPEEGVCVARALRALWHAQEERVAAAAVPAAAPPPPEEAPAPVPAATGGDEAPATSTPTLDTPAAPVATVSPSIQIALIPELQAERNLRDAPRVNRWEPRDGAQPPRAGPRTSTVMHLIDVTPELTRVLRTQDGRVVPISDGEQMHQLVKAVVLRNRMYGSRFGGKILTMRPLLDDTGALAIRFQYIDNTILKETPPPPLIGVEATLPGAISRQRPVVVDEAKDGGYATDDEYGVGAEAASFGPAPAAAAVASARSGKTAAAVGAPAGKSPWILFVTSDTSSMKLAFGIVGETCKPYDRRCPVWLRVRVRPDIIATAALSVAMSQAQVQERANVELLVVPTLERKRDSQNRPYNALTWQLVKYGPGAEPGAAAAAAASSDQPRHGPSPAAMAAAAAAAAKVESEADALMGGTRKFW